MPDGPDLCNCRSRKPAGSRHFYLWPRSYSLIVLRSFNMSRDKNGRFTDCGNPKGRPKASKYVPTPHIAHRVQRNDFFEVDNAAITVSENGKRKQISVRKAIYQKLAYNAALGETRAAVEWNKMRDKFICEY